MKKWLQNYDRDYWFKIIRGGLLGYLAAMFIGGAILTIVAEDLHDVVVAVFTMAVAGSCAGLVLFQIMETERLLRKMKEFGEKLKEQSRKDNERMMEMMDEKHTELES